jgi:adenylate cyclase
LQKQAKTRSWLSWGRRRAVLLVAVGLGATGLSIAAYAGHLLQGPELQIIDTHFSIRGKSAPPRDVAVVAIDATTLDQLKLQWPYPRHLHAQVIDRLHADGAKVIAYDVQFTQPSPNPADDQALANSIYNAHNVVLGTDAVDSHGHVGILGGDQVLRQLGAGWGDTKVKPDGDGIFRRLYYSLQGGLHTFAVAAAERATGRLIPRSSFPGGSVPIDFAGPPKTIPTYSFSKVLRGQVPASDFKGRVVVVGASDPALQDVHQTAASPGELMPGPEIQANAVSTILRGFPLRDAAGWLNVLLIVAMGMAIPLANLRLRSWRIGALALILTIGYVVATQIAFDSGLIVTFVYPLLAVLLATVGTLGADYLFTAFEHQRTRDTFSRFVPDAVVDQVLARAGEDLRLGGEERVCTVMFCDLRGFTSFSETLTASKVIEVVNFYLDQMTDAIMAEGGTLISYMGDGIMALFGAPLSQPDHADRALWAAREMMGERLQRFNAWLRDQELVDKEFRMGIGLNSGTVMAGQVGSEQRVEYTAIGDTTNTASRLEGMTKNSDHMLFMAESTRDLLIHKPDDLVLAGEFEIRGRQAKMRVWSVPDPPTGPAAPNGAEPPAEREQPARSPAASGSEPRPQAI